MFASQPATLVLNVNFENLNIILSCRTVAETNCDGVISFSVFDGISEKVNNDLLDSDLVHSGLGIFDGASSPDELVYNLNFELQWLQLRHEQLCDRLNHICNQAVPSKLRSESIQTQEAIVKACLDLSLNQLHGEIDSVAVVFSLFVFELNAANFLNETLNALERC